MYAEVGRGSASVEANAEVQPIAFGVSFDLILHTNAHTITHTRTHTHTKSDTVTSQLLLLPPTVLPDMVVM